MTKVNLPPPGRMREAVLAAAVLFLIILVVTFSYNRRFKLNYDRRWKELQHLLANKNNWKEAIIGADKLLDSVLKKRRFKGKTMGERLVAAQHELSANDMVWFAHKLTNKVKSENLVPTKAQVKKCLLGFWRALKDLGAFGGDDGK